MILIPNVVDKDREIYSVFDRLLVDRNIFLTGEIEETIVTSIISQLLFLDYQNSDEPINMYVNSPGGDVYSGLALIDTMNTIKSPVRTVGMGMCASMGAMILMSGEKGQRSISKSARVMIHSVSSGSRGTFHDMKIDLKETEYLQNYLTDMIVDCTGKTKKVISKEIERDHWLSAQEALSYGVVDTII